MATKNYTLFMSSQDKISGSNNNAVFNVNWESFLPRDFDSYQLNFCFNVTAGYYKDTNNTTVYSHCKIVLDLLGRSYSYDTSTSGPSITLGFADREPSTATSNTNGFNAWFGYNIPKTIARPTQSLINVKIYNTSYNTSTLLVDTTSNGSVTADMTPWTLVLSFIPIQHPVNSERFPNVINQ